MLYSYQLIFAFGFNLSFCVDGDTYPLMVNESRKLELSQPVLSRHYWSTRFIGGPGRSNFPSVLLNSGDIYSIGGVDDKTSYNLTWKFKTMTSEGFMLNTTGIQLPKLFGHSASLVNNEIYVFGGVSDDNVMQSSVYKLDTSSQVWSVVSTLGYTPTGRLFATSVMDTNDNVCYIIGGVEKLAPTSYATSILSFDTKFNTFSEVELTSESRIPTARYSQSAVIDLKNRAIYMFGGKNQDIYFNDFWVYDIQTSTWLEFISSFTIQPVGRAGHSSAFDSDNNLVYIIGGSTAVGGDIPSDEIWCFDPVKVAWTSINTVNSINMARTGHQSTYVLTTKEVFTIGGYGWKESEGRYTFLNDIGVMSNEIYPTMRDWSQIIPNDNSGQFLPRHSHTLTYRLNTNRAYMVGGIISNTGVYTNEIWTFNTLTNQWSQQSNTNSPALANHATVIYDRFLYIIGGYDGTRYLNDTWFYNIDANIAVQKSWSGSLPPISGHACVVDINDPTNDFNIYCIGGFNEETYYNGVWNTPSKKWTLVNTFGDTFVSRADHTAVILNRVIYILGGYDGFNVLSDMMRFDIVTSTWFALQPITSLSESMPALRGHAATIFTAASTIYVFGGLSDDVAYNKVWKYDLISNKWNELSYLDNSCVASRYEHAMVFNEITNAMYVVSGLSTDDNKTVLADTWGLSHHQLGDNQIGWETLDTTLSSNTFGSRLMHTSAINSNADSVYIIGGYSPVNVTDLNDMWMLNVKTSQWNLISPADGVSFTPRHAHSMVYDIEQNSIYIIGGSSSSSLDTLSAVSVNMNDVWKFNITTCELT